MTTQTEKRASELQSEDISPHGHAVALMFLIVAACLYAFPDYFVSHVVTRLIGAILAVIGVIGLGFELGEFSLGRTMGLENLGVGLGFGLLWAILYYSFHSIWVNIGIFCFLMLSAYGIALAVIQMMLSLYSAYKSGKWSTLKRLLLILGQLTGFVLAVLQIVQIVRGGV